MDYHLQKAIRLHQQMRFHIEELNAVFHSNYNGRWQNDTDLSYQQILACFSHCYHALYLLQQSIKILQDQISKTEVPNPRQYSNNERCTTQNFILRPCYQETREKKVSSNQSSLIIPVAPEYQVGDAFVFDPVSVSDIESRMCCSSVMRKEESVITQSFAHDINLMQDKDKNKVIQSALSENSCQTEDVLCIQSICSSNNQTESSSDVLDLGNELDEHLNFK